MATVLAHAVADLPPPAHWRYRIEGAQKIIFAYCGPTEPEHRPQILALYAASKPPLPAPLPQALFTRHLDPYLLPATHLHLPPPYVARLAALAGPVRPPHRADAACISPTTTTRASLYPDAALHFGPHTILVELKPKAAHLSRSRLIPPHIAHTLGKYTTPTYHLKNYILPHAHTPESPYYPAHLLSHDPLLADSAVHNLLREKARGLRVFRAGRPVDYPDVYLSEVRAAARALIEERTCVDAVSYIQSCDVIDNAGAEHIMKVLISRVGLSCATELIRCRISSGFHQPHFESIARLVAYRNPRHALKIHSNRSYQQALHAVDAMCISDMVDLVAAFLQAAAAKDCSLLVALCPADRHSDGPSVNVDDRVWSYRVWVVDVGEKSIAKILAKWAVEDRRRAALLASNGISLS